MKNSNNATLDGTSFKNINRQNTPLVVRNKKSRFYFSGLVAGIFAAVGMGLLSLALSGTEISAAVTMLVKYIVLGAALGWVLVNHQKFLGENYKFVDGIRQGALVTITAAISLALISVVLYAPEMSLEAGSQIERSNNYVGSVFLEGGIVFIECLVMGMILTFICLQFLKRGRPGADTLMGSTKE